MLDSDVQTRMISRVHARLHYDGGMWKVLLHHPARADATRRRSLPAGKLFCKRSMDLSAGREERFEEAEVIDLGETDAA